MVTRIFIHGPGGSGKTFMLNEVILPVYEEYLPGMSKGVAAQNSAARLIGGSTFHHMAGVGRKQDPFLKKPTRDRREALRRRWRRVALLFIDEISLTSPHLYLRCCMLRHAGDASTMLILAISSIISLAMCFFR